MGGEPPKRPEPSTTPARTRTESWSDSGASAAPRAPALGSVIADRYRLERFIAQGGMGAVYEVEDLELRTRVALKLIRPDRAQDERARERFRREIHLARRVTHPNVCRIFDLGHHTPADEPERRIAFLTMELLDGESLAQRIRRRRLTPAEALPVARQMCAALAAAHAAGVVHRDFKSSNVVLVGARGPDGVRAVVTDFGLAKGVEPEADHGSLSGGGILGSPHYMAPEQVEGGEVTPACDVYALGVVLFEMVTGRLPFAGDSALAVAMQRLRVAPPSPRSIVEDLDARWVEVILRCMARDPRDRFAGPEAVRAALEAPSLAAARPRRARTPTWIALAGVAAAALAGGGVALRAHRHGSHAPEAAAASRPAGSAAPSSSAAPSPPAAGAPSPAATPARRTVAVLRFAALDDQPAGRWLATALAEMFRTELSVGQGVRALSSERTARLDRDLAASVDAALPPEALARARRELGADFVLHGSYVVLDRAGKLRLDLALQDAARQETVLALAETGRRDELFELVARAGARLRDELGVDSLSPSDRAAARSTLPAGAPATQLYAEGLDRQRHSDYVGARDRFERAIAAEPSFPLAHAALSTVARSLGLDALALREARRAVELSAGLPREQRLYVEASRDEAERRFDHAAAVYGELVRAYPDEIDYRLRLLAAQIWGNRLDDAERTLAGIRALPPPDRDDPRVDLKEARLAAERGDGKRWLAAGRRLVAAGRAHGDHFRVAEGEYEIGGALNKLGDHAGARAALQQAVRAYIDAGDALGVGMVLNELAQADAGDGKLAAARAEAERAVRTFTQLGARGPLAWAHLTAAHACQWSDDLACATREYRAGLALMRSLGDQRGTAYILADSAELMLRPGEAAAALRATDEAIALLRQLGHRGTLVLALANRASIELARGEPVAARAAAEESLRLAREVDDAEGAADAQALRARVRRETGDRAGAVEDATQAAAALQRLGQDDEAAATRLDLAALRADAGQPTEALPLARAALATFAAKRDHTGEARAQVLLARLALAAGRASEAEAAIARAHVDAATPAEVQLAVALQRARIAAAAGRLSEALAALASARQRARAHDLGLWRLRIELALGELDRARDPSAAGAQLAAVAAEARRRGLVLLADTAARR